MRKYLFLLSCLLLLSGGLFAQSTEPDKSKAVPEVTAKNTVPDESTQEEGPGAQAVMAATPPEDLISPEVANPTMGREVNSTVDYYTGTANVNVNLYNISSYGISIPVSVKYTASGVKVNDDSYTSVGTNWKITGSGRITRMIMGEPDETGYLSGHGAAAANPLSTEWKTSKIREKLEDKFDGQPDFYRFELPAGQSGMFVINYDKTITLIPYQDVKIEWMNNSVYGNSYFEITDAQGVKYHFGPTGEYKQYAHNDDYERTKDYITSWLLERVTYGEKEIVRYSYGLFNTISRDSQQERFYDCIKTYEYKASDNSVREVIRRYVGDTSPSLTIVEDYPKEVTEIIWGLGKLELVYDDSPGITTFRNRHTGPKLNHINVYGYNNEYLKSIHTDIIYFGQGADRPGIIGPYSRIDRVYEKSGNTVRNLCNFQYDGTPGPGGKVDYWGYSASPDSLEQYSILGKYSDSPYGKPKLITARHGALQKIIYPTGGWTEFEYELHQGRLYTEPQSLKQTAGGLRVKSITNNESAISVASTTRYVYENLNDREKGGQIMSSYKPGPRVRKDTGSGSNRIVTYTILSGRPDFPMTDFTGSSVVYNYVKEILPNGAYTTYEFTDFNSMMDLKGKSALSTSSGLGYDTPDWQYKVPYSTRFYGRGLLKKMTQYDSSDQMVYQEDYSYNYGLEKTSVDAYTSFVTDEESDAPKFYRGTYQWISQPVVLAGKSVSGKYVPATSTEYSYSNGYNDLLPRNVVEKHSDVGTDYFSTTLTYPQDYSYSGTPTQGTEADGIVQLQKMGVKTVPIETIKYRKNDGESNWNVIGSEINIYKWNQTAAMPVHEQTKSLIVNSLSASITKSYISGDELVKDSRYDTYNPQRTQFNKQGNPEFITFSGSGGKGTRIIYGYDGHIPVAQINNVSSGLINHISCTSFEEGAPASSNNNADNIVFLGNRAKSGNYALKKNTPYNLLLDLIPYTISYWRWDGNENTDWEEVRIAHNGVARVIKEPNHYIDEVRVLPADASITTKVVKPGVGVISTAGADGKVTRYNYNELGMLESVADDGRIVEKYSYIEESGLYNLSASVDGGSSGRGQAFVNPTQVSTDGSATFTATPNPGYQFSQWQFSDGTNSTSAVTVRNNIRFNLSGVASFVEFRQVYTMSASVSSASSMRGTASVTPAQVSEGGSATWSATAYSGSEFDRWEFSDGTTDYTSSVTKTNISRNLTGTAFFKEKEKQTVDFYGTIMPRDGYWAIHITCSPDIISYGVKISASGYFFINPYQPDERDAQFSGEVSEDGYILSNMPFDENNTVGRLSGTISFSDPDYTVGTVSWN